MRSRGVPSPDRADALSLTMLEPGEAGEPIPLLAPISFVRDRPLAALESEPWYTALDTATQRHAMLPILVIKEGVAAWPIWCLSTAGDQLGVHRTQRAARIAAASGSGPSAAADRGAGSPAADVVLVRAGRRQDRR